MILTARTPEINYIKSQEAVGSPWKFRNLKPDVLKIYRMSSENPRPPKITYVKVQRNGPIL